jgi:transcriptional regulator GlxA family with amidase domain
MSLHTELQEMNTAGDVGKEDTMIIADTAAEAQDVRVQNPRVIIAAPPEVQILDLAGPLAVFESANSRIPDASYRIQVVSATGGNVHSHSGIGVVTESINAIRPPIDTLIVAGGNMWTAFGDGFVHHIQRLAAHARRVASVCVGSFVLAEAGLLNQCRATTHWESADLFANMYPDVTVDADAIYIRDGNIWTSAGVTAGIDLALAMVADDHGHEGAAKIARNLVVYLQRSGGQSQFSSLLATQAAEREPIRNLLAWLPEHLAEDLTVPRLAEQMNLSERQFTRVFKSETGVTPAEHVETLRLEAACRLLETTTNTVEQIARACGYTNPETMHRAFRRRLNTTPVGHRNHFRPVA